MLQSPSKSSSSHWEGREHAPPAQRHAPTEIPLASGSHRPGAYGTLVWSRAARRPGGRDAAGGRRVADRDVPAGAVVDRARPGAKSGLAPADLPARSLARDVAPCDRRCPADPGRREIARVAVLV